VLVDTLDTCYINTTHDETIFVVIEVNARMVVQVSVITGFTTIVLVFVFVCSIKR